MPTTKILSLEEFTAHLERTKIHVDQYSNPGQVEILYKRYMASMDVK